MRWLMVFLVVAGTMTGVMTTRFMADRDQLLHEHLVEVRATWEAVTHVYRLVADSIVAESANTPVVWSIMRQAINQDDPGRDRARERLRHLMTPVYGRLSERNLHQFHFHLPTAESFLRMHRPARHGDALAGVRPAVRLANTERRMVAAFEIGTLFHGVRYVFPLGDGKTHLGTVEAGVGFDALSAEMAALSPNTAFHIILDAVAVRDRLVRDRLEAHLPAAFAPAFLLDGIGTTAADAPVTGFGTLADPVTQVLARRDDLPARLSAGEAFALPVHVAGRHRAVCFLPVVGATGDVTAYMIAVRDAPELGTLRDTLVAEGVVVLVVIGSVVMMLGLTVDGQRRAVMERRRLLAVADTMAEGLYALDRRGRIMFVNRAAEHLLGWSREELLGCRPTTLFVSPQGAGASAADADPASVAWRVDVPARGAAGLPSQGGVHPVAAETVDGPLDVRFTRADGSRFTAEVTRAPLAEAPDMAGAAVVTFSDVTARREAIEDLRVRNALLQTQLQASPEGILWMDAMGIVRSWNQRLLDLWGLGTEALTGVDRIGFLRLLRDRLADPGGPAERELLALVETPPDAARTGGGTGLEVITSGGRIVEVLCRRLRAEDGVACGHVLFTRDITPFREAERALADRSRALQMANADLRASREDLRRRTTELARLAESLDVARGEAEARKIEAERALSQLRETRAHLVQTERVAALAHLVSGVANEIDAPVRAALTAITHLIDDLALLRRDARGRAVGRRRVARFADGAGRTTMRVRSSLRRAAALVGRFRRVSVVPDDGDQGPFDLRAVVQTAIATVRLAHDAHPADIVVDIASEVDMEGSPKALRHVLEMVLDNALTHGLPDGRDGTVRVATGPLSETGVVVRITDGGVGIARDDLGRVFEPFFTTARGHGHNGLGLHVAFSTVTDVLGGRISLESGAGQGTTVILELPRQAPRRHEGSALPLTGEAPTVGVAS